MPRDFFDHTGDVGVRLSGGSLAELFVEAARAFSETLTDIAAVRAEAEVPVSLDAPSLDDLMIAWLDELLYRFEVWNMLVADVEVAVREAEGRWRLEGLLRSERFDPERHPIKVLIKGVTYHRLDVRREADTWLTDLIFDI